MIVFQSYVIKVKKKKKTFTRYKGVSRNFDWREEPNRKSHAMTLSKFFEKRNFLWDKDIVKWRIRSRGLGLACNLDFAKEKGLEPKVKKISKMSKLGDVVSKLV